MIKHHFTNAAIIEKERFDALERVGFRVDREAALEDWIVLRGGGYYIDVGTSARIANGEIKVKSGDNIKKFIEDGLEFESGEVVEADVVVFATGYQRDPRIQAATIVGNDIAKSMRVSRGLDEDGELEGYMMPVGKSTVIDMLPRVCLMEPRKRNVAHGRRCKPGALELEIHRAPNPSRNNGQTIPQLSVGRECCGTCE